MRREVDFCIFSRPFRAKALRHTDAWMGEGKEQKFKWREHVFDYPQEGRGGKSRDIPFLTL